MNTTDFLEIAAAICPERDAIVFDGKRWTFQQLQERVNRAANFLAGFGVGKGDRVGMLQVNCNQYVEAYFASAILGAIFVPLNFRAKSEELEYLLAHSKSKVVLTGNRYLDLIQPLRGKLPHLQEVITLDEPVEGLPYYQDLMDQASSEPRQPEAEEDEVTILMYTSGTTGLPKGVPQTHKAFVSYLLSSVEPANPEIEERNLLTVPLYHVAGIQAVMAAVYGGRTLVML
ncbi:MAG: AMP-binding protein, partial [Desulfarculaceae bacterium]